MPARVFLFATAAVFVGFGVWGLFSPAQMVSSFGMDPGGADGRTMIRASYGGFLIGEGLLFAWCAMSAQRVRLGLAAVAILTAPILLSRLFGMAVDGATSIYHVIYALIELIGVALAVLLIRLDAKR